MFNKKKVTGYPSVDKTHLEGVSAAKLHPVILPASLIATFLAINKGSLDEVAIERGDKFYTREQLFDDVTNMVRALIMLGLKHREKVAIATPNLYEGIVITMAANAIGLPVVYLNPEEPIGRRIDDLRAHNVALLFACDMDEDAARLLFGMVQTLETIISVGLTQVTRVVYYLDVECRLLDYELLMFDAKMSEIDVRKPILQNMFSKREAFFLQTSGSTSGRPKSLPFTNENVFASLMYAKNSTGTKTHDKTIERVLCILPYRLPYGWMTIFVNLLGGNRVTLLDGDWESSIGEWYEFQPSYIYGTPQMFQRFMEETPSDTDLAFLEAFFCSGFLMSETTYQEGVKYLRDHNSDGEIRNNYGVGEALCIGTASDGVPHRPGTSGKFYVGMDWVIVDENLNEVKYGEVGEIILSSKSLCSGYFKDPDLTETAFVKFRGKRFFRTGDYASLSEDGYVTIYGRIKRFFQPVGAPDKVNCETIEDVLDRSGLVKMSAVAIYPLDASIQKAWAFVVLKDDMANEHEAIDLLMSFMCEELLSYQVPSGVTILGEIPLMKSGKINYVKLSELAMSLSA